MAFDGIAGKKWLAFVSHNNLLACSVPCSEVSRFVREDMVPKVENAEGTVVFECKKVGEIGCQRQIEAESCPLGLKEPLLETAIPIKSIISISSIK